MSETQTNVTQGVDNTAPQPDQNDPNTGQDQTRADDDAANTDDQPEPEQPKKQPWLQRKLAETAYEARETRRQLAETRALLAQYQQPGATPAQNTAPPPGYVPAAEVQRAAAEMLGRVEFNRTCDEIAELGSKLPDFASAVGNLSALGVDTQNANDPFMQAVTALDKAEAARVFHELGSNPEDAERILKMSPARMAVEVAKLAAKPVKVPAVSKAPPPITPISGRTARNDAEPDGKNDEEYRAWFVRERAKLNR